MKKTKQNTERIDIEETSQDWIEDFFKLDIMYIIAREEIIDKKISEILVKALDKCRGILESKN